MSLTLLLGALVAVALDQATKQLVRARLAEGQAVPLGPIRIRRLTNVRRRPGLPLLAAVILAVIALVELGPGFQSSAALLGLGWALGGSAGNVLDVYRRRGVLDFIDLRVWPVFNLADAAIVLGIGLALWEAPWGKMG